MLSPESILDDGTTLALSDAFASARKQALDTARHVETLIPFSTFSDYVAAVQAFVPADWPSFDDARPTFDPEDYADDLVYAEDFDDLGRALEELYRHHRALVGAAFAICPDPPQPIEA
jgi:hypothetical protein